jgi:hypothetical protein
MPLSEALEELLKTMPEEDATAQRALLEKHKTLGEGWLRQSDYSRLADQTKAAEAAAVKSKKDADDWYKKSLDNYTNNNKAHEDALAAIEAGEKERDALKAQLAARASDDGNDKKNQEGNVTEAQLKTAVEDEIKRRGYVSKEELPALIAAEADKLRKNFYEKDLPASVEFQTAMQLLQWNHRDEFKEPLDNKAFSTWATDKGVAIDSRERLQAAYDLYVGPKRTDAEVKRRVEEGVKDEMSKRGVPGTGTSQAGPPALGAVQMRIQKDKGLPEIVLDDTVKLGTGSLAAAAAAELRAEGKF